MGEISRLFRHESFFVARMSENKLKMADFHLGHENQTHGDVLESPSKKRVH